MSKEYSYGVCPYRVLPNGEIDIILIQPKGHTEWGFIKGKIEKNESIPQCAIRETREETNIRIQPVYLENFFEQKNKRKDIGIYLVNVNNINLKNIILRKGEVHRIKYFDISKPIDLNKNQREILEQIKKHFGN